MRIHLIVATVAVLSLGAADGAAEPARRPAVVWAGTGCEEAVMVVHVPLATLQATLPPGYKARPHEPVSDMGTLIVGVASCRTLTVNGQPQASRLLTDAGVLIVPPRGLTNAVYHLWQATAAAELHRRIATLGMDGAYVPDMTASLFKVEAGVTRDVTAEVPWRANAEVPWRGNTYSMDLVTPRRNAQSAAASTWVHEGQRGRVRTEYSFSAGRALIGSGVLRAGRDTRLAAALGGAGSAGSAGLGRWVTFDMTARVYLDRR